MDPRPNKERKGQAEGVETKRNKTKQTTKQNTTQQNQGEESLTALHAAHAATYRYSWLRTTQTGRRPMLLESPAADDGPDGPPQGPRMISKYITYLRIYVCTYLGVPCGNYYSPLEPDALHF